VRAKVQNSVPPKKTKPKSKHSSLLFNIELDVLARTIKQKNNKKHANWKRRGKIIYTDNVILYIEVIKYPQKLLRVSKHLGSHSVWSIIPAT
jgi:hypothetical protein